RVPRRAVGGTGLLRRVDVLFPQFAPDRLRHARGVRGDAVADVLDRAPAGHALPAVAGGRRVHGGVDRAVRRAQQAVRGEEAELFHRPALPADRPGLGAVEALPQARLALVNPSELVPGRLRRTGIVGAASAAIVRRRVIAAEAAPTPGDAPRFAAGRF